MTTEPRDDDRVGATAGPLMPPSAVSSPRPGGAAEPGAGIRIEHIALTRGASGERLVSRER